MTPLNAVWLDFTEPKRWKWIEKLVVEDDIEEGEVQRNSSL